MDQQERLAAQLGVSRAGNDPAGRGGRMLGEAAPGESVAATSALPRLRCEIAASGKGAEVSGGAPGVEPEAVRGGPRVNVSAIRGQDRQDVRPDGAAGR